MAQESKNIRKARAMQDLCLEIEKLYEEKKIDQIVNEQEIKKLQKKQDLFLFELCVTYDLDYEEFLISLHNFSTKFK